MSEPQSLQEICRSNAELFKAELLELHDVQVGIDKSGAEWLDIFIESRGEALDSETLNALTGLVGSFLGECIISEYGGEWIEFQGQSLVKIAAGGTVSPLWMIHSCLCYRSAYSVSCLFAAVPQLARVCVGGLYTARDDEDDVFRVYKVLAADHIAIHLRRYGNVFEERPLHLDPNSLSIALDLTAWQQRGGRGSDLPVGHYPLAHEGFWEMNPVMVQIEPITEDELEGYYQWLIGSPVEESTSQAIELREAVSKRWWQFWK